MRDGTAKVVEGAIERVELYGQDHSPWVQAVLLALHGLQISYSLTTAPPATVFVKYGVLMPAARFDGGPWRTESTRLLQTLGYAPPTGEELAAIRGCWRGVSRRARNPARFFAAASLIRDPHPSALRRTARQTVRGFAATYFFLLLWIVRIAGLDGDPEDFADQFLFFERRLGANHEAYIGGAEPNSTDLLLFGMVQCHCSIPTPVLTSLQKDPRLPHMRAWIGRMHARLARYEHCYSGPLFRPNIPGPRSASRFERAAFAAGAAATALLAPVTVPLILFLAGRIRGV